LLTQFRVPSSELTAKAPRLAKFAKKDLAVENHAVQYCTVRRIRYYSVIIKRFLTIKFLGELGDPLLGGNSPVKFVFK
jgi:hypothetical protein